MHNSGLNRRFAAHIPIRSDRGPCSGGAACPRLGLVPTPSVILRRVFFDGIVTQGEVDDANAIQHRLDERGYRAHLVTGLLFLLLVGGPMSIVEFAGAPLIIMWVLRMWCLWRVTGSVLLQAWFIAFLLWIGWQITALLWSPDPTQGAQELASLRWIWVMFAMVALLDRRRMLIYALAGAYLIANGVQLLHAIGLHMGWDALTFGRMPDRISGWWQPVVGGTMLTGALGLHLPAAVLGRGRIRVLALMGAAVTFLGVIATGSRGPWLASAALVGIVLAVGAAMIRPSRRRWKVIGAGGVTLAAVCAIAWFTIGGSMARRAELAREEIGAAIRNKDFDSDTGARMLMWWWCIEAVKERPLTGIGTGGFQAWVHAHLVDQGIDPATRRTPAHAHSTPLHILATSGLIGLALGALVLFTALHGACVSLDRKSLGTYDAGPLFAIIGLMLAGLFDPVHINAQSAALLFVLFALCEYPRPSPIRSGGA